MSEVFALKAEDMSHASDRMGFQRSETMWVKHFSSEHRARAYAQAHYNDKRLPNVRLEWESDRIHEGWSSSEDMGSIQYHIQPIQINPEYS